MSSIYIKTQPIYTEDTPVSERVGPEIYSLTVTEELSFDLTGTPTRNPVADRSVIADHYIKENKRFSYSGLISNIRNISLNRDITQRTVQENVQKLEELRDSGNPFTVFFDNDQPEKKDCLFTNLSFSKSSGQGNSYRVSISVEQIAISEIAREIALPDQAKEIANSHQRKVNGSDNNTIKKPTDDLIGQLSKFITSNFFGDEQEEGSGTTN